MQLAYTKTACAAALALSCVTTTACDPSALQMQAAAASAIGVGVDASVPVIVRLYEADCGPEADRGSGPLAVCRKRWAPVWAGIDAVAAAQRVWIDSLAVSGMTDWPALLKVACDFANIVRAVVAPTALPSVVSALCPVPGTVAP